MMETNKAVVFLLEVQKFIRVIESVFIDTVSMVIPWLAPLAPASLAYRAMTTRLGFETWLALAMAAVIELLGLATLNTVFQFWSWNKDKKKSDPSSPVLWAVLMVVYYMAVILIVNTLLDDSGVIEKIAKGLLSSISIIGGVTIALRASHSRRIREAREERERIRAERREEKSVGVKKGVKFDKPTGLQFADLARQQNRKDAIESVYVYLQDHPGASISEISRIVGKSRPSVYDYINALKAENRIKENGHGLEVIQ